MGSRKRFKTVTEYLQDRWGQDDALKGVQERYAKNMLYIITQANCQEKWNLKVIKIGVNPMDNFVIGFWVGIGTFYLFLILAKLKNEHDWNN